MSNTPLNVLIVDDEPDVCHLIEDVLGPHHAHCQSVHTGREARRLTVRRHFDVVVLDLLLPDVNGLDLLDTIHQADPGIRVVCVTGMASLECPDLARRAGACEFLTKPFDATRLVEAVVGPAEPVAPAETPQTRCGSQPQQMMLEFAGALVQTVEAKDPHTRRHSEHVAFYAQSLAGYVGLPAQLREAIRVAALLHDVGKIGVPDAVLTKPGPLSRGEFAFIRQHPDTGADVLKKISLMRVETVLVRQHHESWDGSGYPHGLAGESIAQGARILNLADSMDAMLMRRSYKAGYPVDRMLAELRRCAGTQFDPELAPLAIDWCESNPDKLILPSEPVRVASA